jgi:hypothetical protein
VHGWSRHGSDSVRTVRSGCAARRLVLHLLEGIAFQAFELDADRKSLQPARPFQLDSPACQARLPHGHELQQLAVAADQEVSRHLQIAQLLEIGMRGGVEPVGEQPLDRSRRRTRPAAG